MLNSCTSESSNRSFSSDNSNDSSSSDDNITKPTGTLSTLAELVLTDYTGIEPEEGQAIITEAKFVCALYVWYTVKYRPVGSASVESFFSGTSTYSYIPSTGVATINMKYNGSTRGTMNLTIYNNDDTTVNVQSGSTMTFDDEQYNIVNTLMTKTAYER